MAGAGRPHDRGESMTGDYCDGCGSDFPPETMRDIVDRYGDTRSLCPRCLAEYPKAGAR